MVLKPSGGVRLAQETGGKAVWVGLEADAFAGRNIEGVHSLWHHRSA